MASVAELVDEATLHLLATPANFRLGHDIVAAGGVDLIESTPERVTAKVTGDQARTVELRATEQGLKWKCTCTSRKDLFCKHCVATAIVNDEKVEGI